VKASNTGAGDTFGTAVALSSDGNTLAVGAPNEDSGLIGVAGVVNEATAGNAATNSGAVYVYTRTGSNWSQQAYVKASNTGATDRFGNAIALSGDGNTLAVGAFGEASSSTGINSTPDELARFAGAVYVYSRSAGTWSQQAYVKASNTEASDLFGSSVALNGDGNTLAVGAVNEASGTTGINSMPDESAPGAGAAYVYVRSGSTWSQQAYVKASTSGADDNFGNSVALSGDGNSLAVGAPAPLAPNAAGAVYVYTRAAGVWSQSALVRASNAEAGDNFGTSVALSGDGNALAVGAPLEDSGLTGVTAGNVNEATSGNAASNSGAVYLYTRSAGTWSQQAYLKASNTGEDDNFGNSIALSGDSNTLAVGAQLEDGGGTGIGSSTDIFTVPNDSVDKAGAVYLY
jgi:hypothetical protein